MTQSTTHVKDILKLTPEEAESLGVELPGEPGILPEDRREYPLHEQVAGALTESDVVEALVGEVTAESREEIEDTFADLQERATETEEE
ncbi:MAG: hypothetical protein ABSH53_07445 [Holophaga sp.]|jgi:hypothetical protein